MQLDQASIISIVSAIGSAGVVIYTTIIVSKENIKNLKESLADFKVDIHQVIDQKEKSAMALAQMRMNSIEKDVDEIFPRLRLAEENVQKNCIVLKQVQKNCLRHNREVTE